MASPSRLIAPLTVIALLAACGRHVAPAGQVPEAQQVPETTAYVIPSAVVTGGACSLDAINNGPVTNVTLASGAVTTFAGWMGDAGNKVPTNAKFVLKGATSSFAVPVVGGGERPDVAKTLNSPDLARSGYNLVTKLTGVAAGNYDLAIVVEGPKSTECMLNVKINVAQ